MLSGYSLFNSRLKQVKQKVEKRSEQSEVYNDGLVCGQEKYQIQLLKTQIVGKSQEQITFRQKISQKQPRQDITSINAPTQHRYSEVTEEHQNQKNYEKAKITLLEQSEEDSRNNSIIPYEQQRYRQKQAYLESDLSAFDSQYSKKMANLGIKKQAYQHEEPIISSKKISSVEQSDRRVLTRLREKLMFEQVRVSRMKSCIQQRCITEEESNGRQSLHDKVCLNTKKVDMNPVNIHNNTKEIRRKESKIWLCRKFQMKKWIQDNYGKEQNKFCKLVQKMGRPTGANSILVEKHIKNSQKDNKEKISYQARRKIKTDASNHSNSPKDINKNLNDLVVSNKKMSLAEIKEQKYQQLHKFWKKHKRERAHSTLVVLSEDSDSLHHKISSILTKIRQKRKDIEGKEIEESYDSKRQFLTIKLKARSSSSLKEKKLIERAQQVIRNERLKTQANSVAALDTSIKIYSNSQKSRHIPQMMTREQPYVKVSMHQLHCAQ